MIFKICVLILLNNIYLHVTALTTVLKKIVLFFSKGWGRINCLLISNLWCLHYRVRVKNKKNKWAHICQYLLSVFYSKIIWCLPCESHLNVWLLTPAAADIRVLANRLIMCLFLCSSAPTATRQNALFEEKTILIGKLESSRHCNYDSSMVVAWQWVAPRELFAWSWYIKHLKGADCRQPVCCWGDENNGEK